ncbi:MAG: CHAD domain-containing protein [Chitinivibrionales bacterium]|nr:CHAD domain-containing protein [Chitinivibrionales bacterium]
MGQRRGAGGGKPTRTRKTSTRSPRPIPRPPVPPKAVSPDDALGTAAYLDLARLCTTVWESYHATLKTLGGTGLHDLRVSLRRLRQAMRVYDAVTRHTALWALSDELRDFRRGLGPARDSDVWIGRVRRWGKKHADRPGYKRYLERIEHAREQNRRRLKRLLESAGTRRLLARLVAAVSDRAAFEAANGHDVRPHAARKLRKTYRKLLRSKSYDPSPVGLHQLRSRVRKARYAGEIAQPVLGEPADELTRLFKRIADALGTVHDMDVALENAADGDIKQPAWLTRQVKAQRKKHMKQFVRSWERLHESRRADRLLRELGTISKEQHMQLYIVRHGIAVNVGEDGVKRDEDRMLSKRGWQRTEAVGAALAELGWKPERVLTSPLARAAETARILARTAPSHPRVVDCAWLKPDTAPKDMIAALAKRKGATLAIVGHMPELGELLGLLLTGNTGHGVPLRKAAVCCLSFDGRVRPGSAKLEWLMQPKQLVAIGTAAKSG